MSDLKERLEKKKRREAKKAEKAKLKKKKEKEKAKLEKKKEKEKTKKAKLKAKKLKAKDSKVENEIDIFDIDSIIDGEEKSTKLNSTVAGNVAEPENCLHTSNLCIDLDFGGGLQPGRWYTLFGKEQSGKSTLLYGAMGESIKTDVTTLFFDYEGTFDGDWFTNITGLDHETIFGVRDKKSGTWKVKPRARLYKPVSGEEGLLLMKRLLNKMPDKVVIDDTWYYMFEPTKEHIKRYKGKFITKLKQKTGNLYIPIPNNYGGPEIFIGIDSYPAMTPKQTAESEDESKAMAQQARMFSQYVGNVRSLISQKAGVVVGVNQLRDKPGVMFGSPEYEPAGNALKHASDCRARMASITSPSKSGPVEKEGKDEYRYSKTKTIKNKLFVPFRESQHRIWVGHKGKSGFGFDRVFDVYNYLLKTGQIKPVKNKKGKESNKGKKEFIVALEGKKGIEQKFKWKEFKNEILGVKSKKAKKGKKKKPLNLYKKCLKQIRTGKGIELVLKMKMQEEDE